MSRFASLKEDIASTKNLPAPEAASSNSGQKLGGRNGKKGIAGFFSPELSRAMNVMAAEEGTTVQALMGEALDLLMRARGKHVFGER